MMFVRDKMQTSQMDKKKSILFITSTNLATNPRLLKEMHTLKDEYELTYLGMQLGGWSDEETLRLQDDFRNHSFYLVNITRQNKKAWLVSTLVEKLAQYWYKFQAGSLKTNAYASSKRSYLLWNAAQKLKSFDLIIAHNMAALYPAWRLARKQNTQFAFDVEDYHPWESIQQDAKNEEQRRNHLLKRILPEATYVTSASPLIGAEVSKLTGLKTVELINNSFPKDEFKYEAPKEGKLKFVWYSQNISANRGLELVVPELYKFKDVVSLDLIGKLNQEFYERELKKFGEFIHFHQPMRSNELNALLSNYDIGLAIDINLADRNREIALTNKLLTYAQAGLFIFATDTKAQVTFLNDHKMLGKCAGQDGQSVYQLLENMIENQQEIRSEKSKRFEHAIQLSWENESDKLINLIKESISA